MRLLTEREHEIEQFNPEEFWTLNVNFKTSNGDILNSNIISINNSKVEKFSFKNKLDVNNAIDLIKSQNIKFLIFLQKYIQEIHLDLLEASTLQQTASSKLGFGASRTMQIAQRLYQGIDIDGDTVGLITYMRTDGTNISKEAIPEFRNFIESNYGKKLFAQKIQIIFQVKRQKTHKKLTKKQLDQRI